MNNRTLVELVSKQGKARELSSTINDKIVPILKKQPGFVDEILLVSDADSNRVLALSFWKSREDAERYEREQYNSVRETLQSLLESTNNQAKPSGSLARNYATCV